MPVFDHAPVSQSGHRWHWLEHIKATDSTADGFATELDRALDASALAERDHRHPAAIRALYVNEEILKI